MGDNSEPIQHKYSIRGDIKMISIRKQIQMTNHLLNVVFLLAASFLCSDARASDPVLSGRTMVKVSEIGVADVQMTLKTQTNYYTALKQLGGNFNNLARQVGMDGRDWKKQQNLKGNFIDAKNEVEMTYFTPGAARNVKGDHWIMPIKDESSYQLVSATDSHLTLLVVENTAIGLGTMIIDVELPAGSKNAAYNSAKGEISYDYKPSVESGSNAELDFNVEHKPMLMSALAKNYSNPKFSYMWAARSEARNSGDQILSNYRVRFRIAEMSGWSAWNRVARIYPGQSVVDPFYPIFDLDKIMSMNGSRPAVIEVEYEYETADGTKVQETDSFPVQMLSRNEVVFSTFKSTEITGFADQFDYIPALMTAMTTPADPVVQQLAGQVNGMAAETFGQSIAAVQSDEQCAAYLSALFHCIQTNRIAYQSPPGLLTQNNAGQHIKFSRDVLRNRAATCVDFAILWASVCEAVGLEPGIVVIPGHAFPAVKLPASGKWIAIESTMVNATFKEALDRGCKELESARQGDHYLVDITELRKYGVLGLDLPNVDETFLTNLGYKFTAQMLENVRQATNNEEVQAQPVQEQETQEPVTEVQLNPNGAQTDVRSLIGTWGGAVIMNGLKKIVLLKMDGDSQFEVISRSYDAAANYEDGNFTDESVAGTWGKQADQLTFTTGDGQVYKYPFEFSGDELKFCILGGDTVVAMAREE